MAPKGHSRRDLLALGAAAAVAGALPRPARAAGGDLQIFANSTQREPLQAVAPKFEARYPGTRVRLTFSTTDQLQTTTRVQLASGTAADLITVWPGSGNPMAIGQVVPAGFLADVSDLPFVKLLPHFVDDVVRLQGKVWFQPLQISIIGAIVNQRVWAKTGLAQPTRWSELLAACQKLKDMGVVPLALGNGTPFVTQMINYALVPTTVFADNPRFAEDMAAGRASFAGSAGWHQAMDQYLELNRRGFFNANPNGTSYEESLQLVASGKAAMVVQTSGALPNLVKFAGHKEFQMWPLPAAEDPARTQVAASANSGLGVNAKARNREAAIAFLNFLAEPEQLKTIAEVTTVPTLGAHSEFDAVFEGVARYVDQGRAALYMDNKWPNARVQQVHLSGIQELFTGAATPDDLLKRMDQAYRGA